MTETKITLTIISHLTAQFSTTIDKKRIDAHVQQLLANQCQISYSSLHKSTWAPNQKTKHIYYFYAHFDAIT